jgi:hypothetical protein
MQPSQPLPSGVALADDFARELAHLHGPALQPADGTLAAEDLRVQGEALAAAHDTLTTAAAELFYPTNTIAEWEATLGLPIATGAALADRQTRYRAARRVNGNGSRASMLAALRTLDAVADIVPGRCDLQVAGTERYVFQSAVVVSVATFNNAALRLQVQSLARKMFPAQVFFNVATQVGFLCDDAGSLTDRDVLGA